MKNEKMSASGGSAAGGKNKKTFLLVFGVAIFLSGLVFLLSVDARANYAATVNYSCPSGGIISGSMCSYAPIFTAGVNYNKPVYKITSLNHGCATLAGFGGYNDEIPPFCGGSLVGYAADSTFSGAIPYFEDIRQIPRVGCFDENALVKTSPSLCTNPAYAFASPASISGVTIPSNLGGFLAASPGIFGGTYTCKSGDTLSADKTTCTYTATASYSCPSGGTLSGTTCITDNLCAANTCTGQTCWNNLAWVPGTKICADNSCAANTCTTDVCWNNLTWIPGTKICDNGCAAITCNTTTCWNNISWVTGTKICADNSCAANICGLPLPAEICWNNLAWIPGTKDCRIDNLCAASTCQTSNTTPPKPTTCDNGINPLTPGTKSPVFNKICSSVPITCTENDCGRTIPSTTNPTCIMDDATDCMLDTACATPCPAPANQTCPPCPLTINGWREVAP